MNSKKYLSYCNSFSLQKIIEQNEIFDWEAPINFGYEILIYKQEVSRSKQENYDERLYRKR